MFSDLLKLVGKNYLLYRVCRCVLYGSTLLNKVIATLVASQLMPISITFDCCGDLVGVKKLTLRIFVYRLYLFSLVSILGFPRCSRIDGTGIFLQHGHTHKLRYVPT